MSEPLVTIIVPVYNAGPMLRPALDSLAVQTHENVEVLLVDDGSTDGSRAVCEEYAAADPRFVVLSSPHLGPAGARNVGLEHWRGDLLMFADADDLVDRRYVERLLEVLDGGDAPVATCLAQDVFGDPPAGWRCEDAPTTPRHIPLEETDFRQAWSHRVVWGAAFRREAVEGLRFDERYAVSTDTLFMAQVLRRVGAVTHVDERLYCYAMRSGSVSKGRLDERKLDDLRVWEQVMGIFRDGPRLPYVSAGAMMARHSLEALESLARREPRDCELERRAVACLRRSWRFAPLISRWPLRRVKAALFALVPGLMLWRERNRRDRA